MWNFIQNLPNHPEFILILIGLAGLAWFGMPQTEWWKRHIVGSFPAEYPPECFDCNKGNCEGCPYKQ